MDVQDMQIFARVAAVQNLSAVGAELGLTPGTISKRVQALEDELAVRRRAASALLKKVRRSSPMSNAFWLS
jgi:DNA-binding Lrp family transcriptional regulator